MVVTSIKRDAIKKQEYQKAAYFRDIEKEMSKQIEKIISDGKDI